MLNKTVKIKSREIGNNLPPYIIAEMACAHDGSKDKAFRIIDAVAEAKADAVQLQFFVSDETVTPGQEVYAVLKKIEFSHEGWTEIFKYAKSKSLDVFVCTYDIPSVALAVKLGADGIKLNSSDLSNPEVVSAVAKSGIPFTLGTGASTLEEISRGIESAASEGAKNIILMHGVQNFPTRTEDLNISRMTLLRDTFRLPVGYHDHTDGDDPFSGIVDLVAVGMGACIIEKHITFDRAEKGIDYQASLNPAEFKQFVQNIRRAYTAVGSAEIKPFSESELRYRKFQKKSVVAAHEIKKGQKITRQDVKFIRNTEPGLPPSDFSKLDGKIAALDIPVFQNILLSSIVA